LGFFCSGECQNQDRNKHRQRCVRKQSVLPFVAANEARMREERAVWAKEKHKIKLIIHNTELEMKAAEDYRIARASSSSSSSSGRRAMLADEEAKQEQSARALSEAKRMVSKCLSFMTCIDPLMAPQSTK
jgi:hypothetical protein